MADIINLRQVRKQKARADKDKKADENRALFGQTKAEKTKKKTIETLETRRLDGHKREDKPED